MFSPRFARLGLCRHEQAFAQDWATDATLAFQQSGARGRVGTGDGAARTALCAAVTPASAAGSVPPHGDTLVVDVVLVVGVVVVGGGRSSSMSVSTRPRCSRRSARRRSSRSRLAA